MTPEWAPRGVDLRTPNIARMYDYFLGGKDHYPSDREAADRVLAHVPHGREMITENRRFLARVVRFLTGEVGIRQFVDVGTGLPTAGNVHEIAHQHAPDAHVVYVDNDPVVCTHARALLASGNPGVDVVEGDLRHPESILTDRTVTAHIDFAQPVAVLLVAVLHFLTEDDDPSTVVARFRRAMPRGSYLVISHVDASPQVKAAERVYNEATSHAEGRTREQISRFFTDLELADPGLVYVQHWRPDGDERSGDLLFGGVARKP